MTFDFVNLLAHVVLICTLILIAALTWAADFTPFSLPVAQFARSAVSRALDTPISEGLRIEAELSTLAYRTADAEEGMAAFIEKRRAEFCDG